MVFYENEKSFGIKNRPTKDIQAKEEDSSPTENSSNMKILIFFLFSLFLDNFGLPGSGSNLVPDLKQCRMLSVPELINIMVASPGSSPVFYMLCLLSGVTTFYEK
jgi:hypothetical protein